MIATVIKGLPASTPPHEFIGESTPPREFIGESFHHDEDHNLLRVVNNKLKNIIGKYNLPGTNNVPLIRTLIQIMDFNRIETTNNPKLLETTYYSNHVTRKIDSRIRNNLAALILTHRQKHNAERRKITLSRATIDQGINKLMALLRRPLNNTRENISNIMNANKLEKMGKDTTKAKELVMNRYVKESMRNFVDRSWEEISKKVDKGVLNDSLEKRFIHCKLQPRNECLDVCHKHVCRNICYQIQVKVCTNL